MKILVLSDVHTEFWKRGPAQEFTKNYLPLPASYDVVVAAGDIGLGTNGFEWLENTFPKDKTILYVPGNHEYYHNDYFVLQDQLTRLSKLNNSLVTVLNPGRVVINGVQFIGATLWSDLKLKGYMDYPDYIFERGIADFNVISASKYGSKMNATLMRAIYNSELNFIKDQLEATSTELMKKTVVITHFVPSQMLIDQKWLHPQFATLNPYFTNDLDHEVFHYGFPLCIYGHTHDRNDLEHPTGVRCVGNPYGYPNENREPYDWKIVEV